MEDEKDLQELNAEGQDNRLNSFVAELIHLQDDRLVVKQDLEKLLNKYQLTQDDIDKLQMLIDRHLSRAADYTRRERWDNAIVETERALLFSPLDNEIRLELAELFLKRSTKYGYLQKDLNRADHEIQDALTLEPENSEAKKFQKELKDLKKMLQGRQNNKKLIPLLLILVIILGVALFPQIRKRFRFLSLQNQEVQTSAESVVPPWETKSVEILTSDTLTDNFELSFKDSTLIRTSVSGTPALSIAGYLEPLKDDYSHLELELMPDSQASSGITIPLINGDDAPLRRGETESFSRFIYLKEDPKSYDSLYITVKSSQKYYEDRDIQWKKIDYYKTKPLPQGIFIDLEEQLQAQLEGYDRYYLFYDIRLTNKSIANLTALDLDCFWTDSEGVNVSGRMISLVEDADLPIRPQTIQTTRVMFDLPKRAGLDDGTLNVTLKRAEKD